MNFPKHIHASPIDLMTLKEMDETYHDEKELLEAIKAEMESATADPTDMLTEADYKTLQSHMLSMYHYLCVIDDVLWPKVKAGEIQPLTSIVSLHCFVAVLQDSSDEEDA